MPRQPAKKMWTELKKARTEQEAEDIILRYTWNHEQFNREMRDWRTRNSILKTHGVNA